MSQAVATVAFLQGKAWAKSPDGELRPLTVGSVLNANDILVTGLNAKVELDTGDLKWLTIGANQEVSMSRDLRTESATTNEEARLTDATVQEALTILEQGGDLLEELEETAAGNTAGGGGSSHGFVQLARLIEQVDPQAFNFDAANADAAAIPVTDTEGPRNNPPEVVDQQLVFDEDTVLTGQIIATDIENDTLTYMVATQPANGVLVLDSVTGSFTFTPNSNFNGIDSFVVTVTDTAGNSVNNIISLTINPVNDAPVSSAQPIVTNEDTPVTGQIVATDVENDVLSFVVSTNPANGVVTINAATGAYEYTPNTNFYGVDSFVVTVSDGNGGVSSSSVAITVNPVNDAPVATNQNLTTNEDTPINGQIIASDVDADPLTYTVTTNPVNGSLLFNANGSFTYTPNLNYNGNDSFIVTVSDGKGGVTTSNISIGIPSVNDAPVTSNQTITTNEDTVYNGQIIATDVDADTLTYSINTTPINGSLTLNQLTGQFTYTPNANYYGSDSFSVLVNDGHGGIVTSVVTVGVTSANDIPVAQAAAFTVAEDAAVVSGAVIATDSDADAVLTYSLNNAAPAGLIFNADGSYLFDPSNAAYQSLGIGQSQVITVPFTATDNLGATSTANLVITVTGTNDVPVAQASSFSVAEDAAVINGNVSATDVDANAVLTYALNVSAPAGLTFNTNGSYSFDASNAAYQSLNVGQSTILTIPYTVTDDQGATSTANLVITVTGTNDVPVAQAAAFTVAEDAAIVNGSVVATDIDAGATLTYALNNPAPAGLTFNTNGTYSFDASNAAYQSLGVGQSTVITVPYVVIDDQGATSTANLVITVTGTNDAPVAQTSSFSVAEDAAVINGSVNATDIDANAVLIYSLNVSALAGLTFNANGSYSFDASNAAYQSLNVGQSTILTIPYTVTDDQGATSTANLVITVTGTNDVPVAQAAAFTVAEDAAIVNGSVVATDIDAGATLTYALNNPAPAGLTFNTNGTYSFDASNAAYQSLGVGQSQVITVPFTATDNLGATSTANLVITVTGTNDVPVAQASSFTVAEDAAVINGSVNSTDVDANAVLTYSLNVSAPAGLTFNANGSYSFDASNAAYQSLSFGQSQVLTIPYTVTDDQGATSTANLVITITGTNDAPVAQAATFTVAEDSAVVNGSVVSTDVDAGATLTYALNNPAPAGLIFDVNGSYSFDASNAAYQSLGVGQSQVITVPYTVTDDQGATSTANLVITVTGTNDVPVAQTSSFSVAEDAAVINGSVSATDIDANAVLTYSLNVSAPAGLTFNANGSYSFDASNAAYQSLNVGQSVILTIPYTVTDDQGATSTENLVITVTGTNDGPVANTDVATTPINTAVTIDVRANDSDVDNAQTDLVVSNPQVDSAQGTVVLDAQGRVVFTPASNFSGVAIITYTLTDPSNASTTGTVTVTVGANTAPTGTDNIVTVNEDGSHTFAATDFGFADADAAQTLNAVRIDSLPAAGSLTLGGVTVTAGQIIPVASLSTLVFTPAQDANGINYANFTFSVQDSAGAFDATPNTIQLNVTAVNDAPAAQSAAFTVAEDAAVVTGNLVATDVDTGALLTYTLNIAVPAGFTFNPDGSYSFDPSNLAYQSLGVGQSQVITIPYTVTDDQNASSTANLVITVTGTNDVPVAQASSFTVAEDAAVINGNVNATDIDANAVLTYSLNNAAPAGLVFNSNGTYSFDASNAVYQSLGVSQSQVLTVPYTVTDDQGATSTANLVITVTGTNDAPVAQAAAFSVAEDTAIVNGSVAATDIDANATLTYALNNPAPAGLTFNANGTYSFDAGNAAYQSLGVGQSIVITAPYTVIDDQGATSTANLVITVTGTNDVPAAQASSFTVAEDAAVINGSVNATDIDANAVLTYSLNNPAPAGLTFNANGSYSFDASNLAYQSLGVGQSTVITIPYTVTDDQNATSTANLVITVTGTNDAPVAQAAAFTVAEDAAIVNGSVVATDIDANAVLTYSLNNAAPAGLVFNANGSYSFDANNAAYQSLGVGQSTVLTIAYTVTDDQGATSTENLVITVTGTNDGPVANTDVATTPINTAVTIDVRANDTDVDNVQTDLVVSNPQVDVAQGTAVLDAQGRVVFTPASNFSGVATITYTLTDPSNASTTGTVTVNVGANTAPTGTDNIVTVNEDGSHTFTATDFGFADADAAQTLNAVRIDSLPAAGSLTLGGVAVTAGQIIPVASLGTLVFAPAQDANGINYASFTFSVQDSAGAFDVAPNTVQLNVAAVNDAPVAQSAAFTVAEDAAVVTGNLVATDVDTGSLLTYTLNVAAPAGFTFNPDGSYSFDPSNLVYQSLGVGQSQVITIPYTVTDDQNATSTANLVITVTGTNDTPVAQASSFSVAEDAAIVNGSVTAADIDAGATLTYALNNSAPAGLIFNSNGTYSFDASNAAYQSLGVGQSQVITVPYTVIDDQGATSTANLVITVTGTNDAPVAQASSFSVAEDAAIINGNVNATDIDANAVLTYSLNNTAPAGLIFNANGTYSFDASNAAYQSLGVGQSTVLTIAYTVTDDQSATSSANLVITVTGTNDVPVAQAAAFSVAEDAAIVNGSVTATDIDAGSTLTYALNNPAPAGLIFNSNGTYSFDASNAAYQSLGVGQSTVITIPYTVTDDQGAASTANLVITVTGTNDAPVAQALSLNGSEDSNLAVNLIGNDIDGSVQSIQLANLPTIAQGTLYLADGITPVTTAMNLTVTQAANLIFTPSANFNGNILFDFTVTDNDGLVSLPSTVSIAIAAVNDAPVNAVPSAVTMNEDTTQAITGLGISDVDSDTGNLTVTLQITNGILNVSGGSALIAGNGTNIVTLTGTQAEINSTLAATVNYVPTANFNGSSTLTLTTSDNGNSGTGGTLVDVDTVSITVNQVWDITAPSYTTTGNEDSVINDSVGYWDSTTSGGVLTYQLLTSPANGTLVFNADGTYTYTPNANFNGNDSFTYRVIDATSGESANRSVGITINPVNDAPTAQTLNLTGNEDANVSVNLTGSDIDAGDSIQSVQLVSLPSSTEGVLYLANGITPVTTAMVLTAAQASSLIFTPATHYVGNTSFNFVVIDTHNAASLPASVSISLSPVNDAPVNTVPATQTLNEDSVKAISGLSISDVDAATGNMTVTLVVTNGVLNVSGGTAGISGSGTSSVILTGSVAEINSTLAATVNYVPVANFYGTATLTMTTGDNGNTGAGGSLNDVDVVTINVDQVWDILAPSYTASGDEDTIINGSVGYWDSTTSGGVLTYQQVSNPANGTLVFNTNGTYSYTPNTNFSGTDSFSYLVIDAAANESATRTVTITVNPVNDGSIANQSASTNEDAVLNGNLPTADADGAVTYAVVTNQATAHGTVSVAANGTYVYTPAANYSGADSFTVNVTDAQGFVTPVTVNITVNPVNDGSVANQTASTNEDTVLNGNLPTTDADGAVTYAVVTNQTTAHGIVSVAANGAYVYAPVANYSGADSFTVNVTDAQGFVTPVTVNITVNPVDDGSVANQTVSTNEDTVLNGNLPTSDADGAVTYSVVTNQATAHGTFSVAADGSYTYTPAANYAGSDSFTVNVTDSQGFVTPVTVNVTVYLVDHDSVPNQTVSVAEDTVLNGNLPTTDADGAVTYSVISNQATAHGVVSVAANGSYVYTPVSNYFGSDSFIVSVTDSKGFITSVTVNISVNAVNDAPVNTIPATQTTNEDTSRAITGLSISDVDSGSSTMTVTLAVTNGTLTVTGGAATIANSGTGTVTLTGTAAQINATLASNVTYAPAANFNGAATLTMTTSDGSLTDVDTVNITVNAVNDAPVNTVPAAQTTNEDTSRAITGLSINDVDAGSSTMTVTLAVTNGTLTVTGGTATIANSGTGTVTLTGTAAQINSTLASNVTYAPTANFNGAATLTMTTSDGSLTDVDTVNITVSAVNDAPVNTVPAAQTTNEDTSRAITGLSISDVDSGSSTMTVTLAVTNGTLTVTGGTATIANSGTGTVTLTGTAAQINATLASNVTYAPTANFNGAATLTMTTSDGSLTDVDTVSITVNAVNDAPVNTVPAAQTTNEDTSRAITGLSISDVDSGSSTMTVTLAVTNGTLTVTGGTATIANSGTGTVTLTGTAAQINSTLASNVTYAPTANFNGAATLTMTTSDGSLTDVDTVNITVNAVNDAPVTTTANLIVNEEVQNSSLGIVAPTDIDSASLTITVSGLPSVGSVTLANGTAVTVGQTLTIAQLTSLQYDAPADVLSTTNTSFTYSVNDGTTTVTGTANITVNPVNDAPVANDDPESSLATTPTGLLSEYYGYREGTDGGNLVNIPQVLAFITGRTPDATFTATQFRYGLDDLFNSDLGRDTNLQAFLGSDAASLSADPATTSDAVIRMRGYVELDAGSYNFRVRGDDGYQIKIDGVVVAQVNAIQSPTGTVHSTFSVATSGYHQIEILYWDQGGQAVFQAEISDNSGTTYQYLSQLPTVKSGVFNLQEDNVLTITPASLLTNDTDADGDTLSIISVSNAVHGTVSIAANGNIIFTPTTNYSGPANFDYTVSDGKGGTDTAKVAIYISPVNDAPVATTTGFTTNEDIALTLTPSQLATDIENDILTISVSSTTNGTATVNSSGNVVFTPTANYSGPASFTYTVSDGQGGSTTATANITVVSVNDAPAGTSSTVNIVEDKAYTLSASNFGYSDVDNNSFSGVRITTLPGGSGILYLNNVAVTAGTTVAIADINAGKLVYVPGANSTTSRSFTFQVQDDGGTANGGVNLDQSANTMTFAIAADTTDLANTGTGNHTYTIALNAGTVSVLDSGGTDSISITSTGAPTFNAFNFERAGSNLEYQATSGANATHLTVLNEYVAANTVETITFSGGGNYSGYALGTTAYTINTTGTGVSGTQELIVGSAADDSLTGGGGATSDMLFGGAGNDTLTATGSGTHLLVGGSGNDTLTGGTGVDVLLGGLGNDSLTGGTGADVFVWKLADKGTSGSPATDTVADFTDNTGDKLNISDLLQGENSANLTNYLHFTYDSGTNATTVHISSSGGYSSGYNSSVTDQTIVLSNYNPNSNSDATIINNLITAGKLITD